MSELGTWLEVQNEAKNSDDKLPLGVWNKINLGAFFVNLFTTAITNAGVVGVPNDVLSSRYQTLVTPSPSAFFIWALIFLGELIFAFYQMSAGRGSNLVTAMGPWWLAVCITQSLWGFLFAFEYITASTVMMALLLVSLMGICWAADREEGTSSQEFWLMRAVFSVHLGWIMCAFTVNFNLMFDAWKSSPEVMLTVAISSVAVLFSVATLYALGNPKPDAGPPLVVAWASYWISQELSNPKLLLSASRLNPHQWESSVINGVGGAASVLSITCLGMSALAVVLRLVR
jgi:benzodiazapine receptor